MRLHEYCSLNVPQIFMNKIFSQNFFSNFFSKFFCRNFPQNFFLEFFSKFFFQIFLSKFFSKFFRHLFRGFRMRDTRVLRAPHAGFFSWLYEFWQKILTKNFEKKIWKKNSVGSSTSFITCPHPDIINNLWSIKIKNSSEQIKLPTINEV